SPDLVYLTGYDPMPLERPSLLVIRPDRPAVLVLPELERRLAHDAIGDAIELMGWTDAQDPYAVAAALLPATGTIGVGDKIWGVHVLALQDAVPGARFTSAAPVLGAIRARKDPDELAALRRAARGADETFRAICSARFLGRREEEVAADLADLLVRNGHSRADFTIVGSGPNSASPHHEPSGRTILPRDVVVMDFGGELGGYYSDTTRTVVVGDPPKDFEHVYRVVQEAQEAACSTAGPGVLAQDVDRAARNIIDQAGFGARFFHRTGHGIGLEVHEPPYIVAGNATRLERGMTFSVEPGIYLDGQFGVRIEDIVVITEDGADRLNRSSREPRTVD
ncbi:MAG: aminopeptidase P family protein, partial [Actinomycetota bacterium]